MSSVKDGFTINEIKRYLIKLLKAGGIESADIDARLLLMHGTGLTRSDLIASGQNPISAEDVERIKSLATRRINGEPIDHILGYREFYGRRFKVTKDVLSPRPETEMLVAAALSIISSNPAALILDLGTGSGAIIISILAEAPKASGAATDISDAALLVAKENAKAHAVYDRVEFSQGEWFTPVKGAYDIIISNPPYITKAAMEELSPEVKNFDPHMALSGGDDGLQAYRAIISKAKTYLKPSGHLLFEIGFDQGASVSTLLKDAGFFNIFVDKDLAGHDRIIRAKIV